MGNQQRSLELRLAWFGGILDGEGTISFASKYSPSSRQTYYHFRPYISLTNSSQVMMDEVMKLLDEIGCAYHVRSVNNPAHRDVNWKVCTQINIEGMKRLQRVLPIIRPYLICKGEQADVLLQYIESRFAGNRKHHVNDDQLALVLKVKQLNHRGVLNRPETVRRTPKMNGDDTVRPQVRA